MRFLLGTKTSNVLNKVLSLKTDCSLFANTVHGIKLQQSISRFQGTADIFGLKSNFQQSRGAHFVQSVLDEYKKSQEKFTDRGRLIVHFNLCNNTFVNVSDENGKTIAKTSAGCLKNIGRARSKFATEAVAEHIGQVLNKEVKPIIVKIKGTTFWTRKKAAIMGLRKGLGKKSLITYIEDVTRLPHGGCRLRKRRRV